MTANWTAFLGHKAYLKSFAKSSRWPEIHKLFNTLQIYELQIIKITKQQVALQQGIVSFRLGIHLRLKHFGQLGNLHDHDQNSSYEHWMATNMRILSSFHNADDYADDADATTTTMMSDRIINGNAIDRIKNKDSN